MSCKQNDEYNESRQEYIEQDSILQAEIINDMMEQLWTDLKQTKKKDTYLSFDQIAKILVDALGVEEMNPLMTAMASEIVRVKELKVEQKKSGKSNWVDDLLS